LNIVTSSNRLAAPGPSPGCSLLIPVKARATGKTRLSARLDPRQRIGLVRRMLDHVLDAAHRANTIRQIIVVSPERDTLPGDIPVLADSGVGLNKALSEAHRALLAFGVRELLILPADLPTLAAADIDVLVEAGRATGFAVAPDASGCGTNGLYLSCTRCFDFEFGPDSRERHVDAALRLGLGVATVSRPGLEFDVDCPSDLEYWDPLCLQLPRLA
jgi:2-phospho-L-lactate/phosphoenolpyruvate guanylyltransferase